MKQRYAGAGSLNQIAARFEGPRSALQKWLDNAPMEGFWGTLKSEIYYLHHFEAYSQLCEAVAAYIYFYNQERYQRKFGCMTPMEFLAAGVK